MSLRSVFAAATLILVPAFAPVAASAAPVISTDFDSKVAHDDLDLTTREGVSRLDERVRTKVRQMCQNGGRDSVSVRLERECRQSALAATAPSVRMAIAEARLDAVRLAERSPASPAATPGA